MAYTTALNSSAGSAFAPVWRVLAGMGNALVRLAETNPKLRELEALSALSDEELAHRGIRREEIVRRVFGGSPWV